MLGSYIITNHSLINGFHPVKKNRTIWRLFWLLLFFTISSLVNVASATDSLLAYTNQIINEAKVLKDKTLNADIPKPHRKKLKNHLKDVIKHLKNARKKLKKGKTQPAKKQFRQAYHSTRRYIRTIKRKINKERIAEEVAEPLKADAKPLRRHIRQLIHGYTGNITPIANAGIDQAAPIGQAVMLDGSASSDADGDLLSFYWTIIEQPSGSDIQLSNPDSVTPELFPSDAGLYIIELVVTDEQGASSSDVIHVNVESMNTAPVAHAGYDQIGQVGETITLDARASSDAEGDSLSYLWNLTTIPSGSSASLDSIESVMPNFVADVPGRYQAELIVNDGSVDSAPDYVDIQIDSLNTPPVADAGDDQSVYLNQLVTLDGSASSDVDGDLLSWFWSISSQPVGSTAELDDDGLVQPAFSPDLAGQYVIQLIVDDGEDSSQPDSVMINALKPNTLPIADAGRDQSGYVGDVIQLDANGSSDADNDSLSFDWSLITTPSGSSAVLDYPDRINPSFLLDSPGNYVAQLIVNDGQGDSVPDEVVISTLNSRPVADPGNDDTITIGEILQLDGRYSSDADGQDLSYRWSVISSPDDSTAVLSDPQSATASFEPDLIGFYVFQLIVSDGYLDSQPVTVTLQVDATEILAIEVFAPEINLLTNQAEVNFRGRLNHPAALTINDEPVTTESDLSFNHVVSLTEGSNSFILHAIDATLVEVEAVRVITLDTIVPITPELDLITISDPDINGLTSINGQDGSVEPLATVIVRNLSSQEEVSALSDDLGSFSIQLTINHSDDYHLLVQDNAGNQSGLMTLIEGTTDSLPPDPATIAPALNPTQANTLYDATAFLFSGSNPVQTGLNPNDIEAKRVAVLRGKVMNRDNIPLSGVVISIKDHPEFGQTLSREDGQFDMVVNGGELLIITYEKTDYLPVQRKVQTPWRDYIQADDVVMIALDPQVTTIDLSNSQDIQIAQGSIQTDTDGSRQATLFFSPGTTATMTLPNGTTQALDTIDVRASEYTLGDNGPESMPGPLPATSAYTYAVELSVDEAIAAGADTVEFNQPVNVYVDNFLAFPVGEIVPVGYYDRSKAAWIASKNGKVIKIISHTNGVADMSVDSSGSIATQLELDEIGITLAEQSKLAQTYSPGTELWFVQVEHLTPWDMNFPYGPPLDAISHNAGEPKTENEDRPDDPCEQGGCIIEAENQVLGQRINVTGTPFSLNYRSSHVPGNKTNNTLVIPLSGDVLPASLKRIELRIRIAGRVIHKTYPATPNQIVTWEWDGRDVYGREINGSQSATVYIDYVYNLIYYTARADLTASFSIPGVRPMSQRNSMEIKLSKTYIKKMGGYFAKQSGMGYWSLSPHHIYDPIGQTLYYGDGSERRPDNMPNTIDTIAGVGRRGFSGDGGLANEAELRSPSRMFVAPDGKLYFADAVNYRIRVINTDGTISTIAGNGSNIFSGDGGPALNASFTYPSDIAMNSLGEIYIAAPQARRVRKIDKNGIITTIAGTGEYGFSGDGGPAIDAKIWYPTSIAIGPDDEVYISDSDNQRIRKIGTDGIITTVAGNGQRGFSGDGGLAVDAAFHRPHNIAVDKNGILYIADANNRRIRRVGTDGIITTIVGNGLYESSGDGGLAIDASIMNPSDISFGSSGELYITDYSARNVRRVGVDGVITTIAGNGDSEFFGDGGQAVNAGLCSPSGVTIGAEEEIYISDSCHHRIRRIAPSLPGFPVTDVLISSKDGQKLFQFNSEGRHLRTINTITAENLYSFNYTESGLLDSITDKDEKITQIQRDANDIPTGIIAPYGQITSLDLDGNGYLNRVTNPLGEGYFMTYDSSGLMLSFKNPNNASSSYLYDSLGRLTKDIGPENSGWDLLRSGFEKGYGVTMTSAQGRNILYQVSKLGSGDYLRETIFADGTLSSHLSKTDGEAITTFPDGTSITTLSGPDPRFGLLSPILTSRTIQTPNGLEYSQVNQYSTVLEDSSDPLSLVSLSKVNEINGQVFTSQYDTISKTWTNTSASGRTNTIQINSDGRPVMTQVSGLNTVHYNYDSNGKLSLITTGMGGLARTTLLSFYQSGPMAGYLQSMTNAESQTVHFEYDEAGRVTKQILPDNREILYHYDANGNLTSLNPPGRPAHIFNFDGLDQATQYTPPIVNGVSNPQTTYSYNQDKQLVQIVRPDGQEISLNYATSNGKLENIIIPSGSKSYVYNLETGQLTSVTAPDGSILNFSYDGFLHTKTQWSGDIIGIVAQNYDNGFRIANRNINGTHNIDFQYDSDSLLIQVGGLDISREIQKGGLINATSLDNLITSRTFNDFAELNSFNATYNGTDLYSSSYSRDKLGRISQKVETIEGEISTTGYEYDLAGRLVSETNNNVAITYSYDSNGNRTHINGILVSNYDEQDRLLSYAQSDYQYSANGELKTKVEAGQTTLYHYDVLGNLKQVTFNDGTVIDYIIDGRNRRIGKKVGGTLIQGFLYKDQLNPIAELDGNNQIISRFVYGTKRNIPDYLIKNGVTYRIISDHLGSPRLIVDSVTGDIIQRMDYDTWGNIVNDTNPGFQPFGFAGGLYDQHTSMTRFGMRDYDAWTGRWTLKDPIHFNGGDANLYGYVVNNPINWIDPWGLDTTVIVNNNTPVTGTHTGVVVGSGADAGLYDPGGSYPHQNMGSDYTLEGYDVNLEDYIEFQLEDGPDVQTYTYPTTPAQEALIMEQIDSGGFNSPGFCAMDVSGSLNGIGPFKDLGISITPNGLGDSLQGLPPPSGAFVP